MSGIQYMFLKGHFLNAFLLDINPGAELHSHRIHISSALVGCVQKFSKVVLPVYLFSIQKCILHPCQCLILSLFVFQLSWWVCDSIFFKFLFLFHLRLMKLNTILCFLLIGNTPFEAPVKVTPNSAFLKIGLCNFCVFL